MNEYTVHFLKETVNLDHFVVKVQANSLDEVKEKVHDGEFEVIDVIVEYPDINPDFTNIEITSVKQIE